VKKYKNVDETIQEINKVLINYDFGGTAYHDNPLGYLEYRNEAFRIYNFLSKLPFYDRDDTAVVVSGIITTSFCGLATFKAIGKINDLEDASKDITRIMRIHHLEDVVYERGL
jgi:hypothetical protein